MLFASSTVCLYKRKTFQGSIVKANCSDTHKFKHIHTSLLHTYLYKLKQPEKHQCAPTKGRYIFPLYFSIAINKNRHRTVSLHFVRIRGALENPSFCELSNVPTVFPPFFQAFDLCALKQHSIRSAYGAEKGHSYASQIWHIAPTTHVYESCVASNNLLFFFSHQDN